MYSSVEGRWLLLFSAKFEHFDRRLHNIRVNLERFHKLSGFLPRTLLTQF